MSIADLGFDGELQLEDLGQKGRESSISAARLESRNTRLLWRTLPR